MKEAIQKRGKASSKSGDMARKYEQVSARQAQARQVEETENAVAALWGAWDERDEWKARAEKAEANARNEAQWLNAVEQDLDWEQVETAYWMARAFTAETELGLYKIREARAAAEERLRQAQDEIRACGETEAVLLREIEKRAALQ